MPNVISNQYHKYNVFTSKEVQCNSTDAVHFDTCAWMPGLKINFKIFHSVVTHTARL